MLSLNTLIGCLTLPLNSHEWSIRLSRNGLRRTGCDGICCPKSNFETHRPIRWHWLISCLVLKENYLRNNAAGNWAWEINHCFSRITLGSFPLSDKRSPSGSSNEGQYGGTPHECLWRLRAGAQTFFPVWWWLQQRSLPLRHAFLLGGPNSSKYYYVKAELGMEYEQDLCLLACLKQEDLYKDKSSLFRRFLWECPCKALKE